MLNARKLIGSHDVLLLTLDTLRYDVACRTLEQGRTPNLAAVLPQNLSGKSVAVWYPLEK